MSYIFSIYFSGYFLSRIIADQSFENITHLIIDEVHERDTTTDFLLIGVKDALKKYRDLKVILMSATVNSEAFSEYFNNCTVIKVPGRMFDVDTIYLEDLLVKTSYQTSAMAKVMAGQQTALEAYEKTIQSIDIDHDLLLHTIKHIHDNTSKAGSILVFLPGYQDIMEQKDSIEEDSGMENYELFILHGSINGRNASEQARVFARMDVGIRKIILSTNIAETSLTIDDVVSTKKN